MRRSAIQRFSESSSDNSDGPYGPDGKRAKRTLTGEEVDRSSGSLGEDSIVSEQFGATRTTEGNGEVSGRVHTSPHHPSSASKTEVGGIVLPSTSREAIIPLAYMRDGSTEIVCRKTRNGNESVCLRESESSDSNVEEHKKCIHKYPDNCNSVTDCLVYKLEANIHHRLSNSGTSYETEPEDYNDRNLTDWDISLEIEKSAEVCTSGRQPGVVSTREEGDISCHVSCSVADTAFTTEEPEGRSEEVDTSFHQPCAVCTAASTFSPALEPVARTCDRISESDSQKCPICLAPLVGQEVGTPDACDHYFCVKCLEEWSSNSNTCPLDREQFNVILVRQYPSGLIIRKIFLRPRWHRVEYEQLSQPDLLFCVLCFNSDVEATTLFCFGCGLFYHLQCLRHIMHNIPDNEWFCPFCIAISFATEAY